MRDESNKDGIRMVVELRRDMLPELVLNQLYNYTQLQTSFGVNLLALNNGQPKQMNLLEVLQSFVNFAKYYYQKINLFIK